MVDRVFVSVGDLRIRDFLYELVSGVGFGTVTLPTGKEVLERLKSERPILIFIDDISGEYSGLALAKKIREFDGDARIIMIGKELSKDAIQSQLQELKISAYITSDFQDSEVIKSILFILHQRGTQELVSEKKWGRVLVVDDEFEIRETVGNFLRRRGFEIGMASSGEECLEKVRQNTFDAILLDVTMGGLDGMLVLKRIMEINKSSKVVMVTAIQNDEILKQAQAIGALDYIVKPFNFALLEATLLSILIKK